MSTGKGDCTPKRRLLRRLFSFRFSRDHLFQRHLQRLRKRGQDVRCPFAFACLDLREVRLADSCRVGELSTPRDPPPTSNVGVIFTKNFILAVPVQRTLYVSTGDLSPCGSRRRANANRNRDIPQPRGAPIRDAAPLEWIPSDKHRKRA